MSDQSSPRPLNRLLFLLPIVLVVGLIVVAVNRWSGGEDSDGATLPRSAHVEAFYLGGSADKAWLFPERRTVTGAASQVEAAVNQALGASLDPDYSSGFPEGTTAGVNVEGATATIDLRGGAIEADPGTTGAFDGALSLQALVHTVVANTDGVKRVRFLVAGQSADTLLGVSLDDPLAPAAADRVTSPVLLALDEGALLQPGAEITGTAAAFEGTVVWKITGASGATIEEGHTTTEECCRPMPFAITLPTLPAGTYVLTVAETDPSDGEGFPPAEDSKTFTLG